MSKSIIRLDNIKRNFQVGDETVHAAWIRLQKENIIWMI